MRRVFLYVFLLCLFCSGCKPKKNEKGCNKLVKIEIIDSCFKKVLTDYIKVFHFEGKGVYLATVSRTFDTVKYFVDISFTEQNLNTKLKNPPYYFYDIISNRIVIVNTKYEEYIKPIYEKYDCDTVLSKYLDHDTIFRWREVYLIEFSKYQDTITKQVAITKKVVRFYPY